MDGRLRLKKVRSREVLEEEQGEEVVDDEKKPRLSAEPDFEHPNLNIGMRGANGKIRIYNFDWRM